MMKLWMDAQELGRRAMTEAGRRGGTPSLCFSISSFSSPFFPFSFSFLFSNSLFSEDIQ